MKIPELGQVLRQARAARGLTQAEVAAAAGLARNTLNRIENGLYPDLGIKKASSLLRKVGLELTVQPLEEAKPDYLSMASVSSGVSFREQLTPEELTDALLSGRAPADKHAHFIVLLEEAPAALLNGLIEQVGSWVKPGKVKKNLEKIARQVGLTGAVGNWKQIA